MLLFSLIIGIGASLALWRLSQVSDESVRLRWLLAGVWILAWALIGARVGFVLTYIDYYSQYSQKIIAFWQGGLSGWGAFVGAILGSGLLAAFQHKKFVAVLDKLIVMLPPLVIAAWLACWENGAAYGAPLDQGTWWGMMSADTSNLVSLRLPLQPAAAISILILFWLSETFIKTTAPGLRFGLASLVFSIHSLLFSLMRADAVFHFLGYRLDLILSILFSLIFLAFCGWIFLRGFVRKDTSNKDRKKAVE